MPRSRATRPATSMASTQGPLRVPMLSTSAEAIPAISAISSWACAMTGEAPAASRALAVVFITTKLVMLWMSGAFSRIR